MTKDKNIPKVVKTDNSGPVQAGTETGTVAETRRIPLVDPAKLVSPPISYQTLPRDQVRQLSKLADNQEAELSLAVQQIIDRTAMIKTRFGEMGPDTTQVAAVWKRYKDSLSGQVISQKLFDYYSDVRQVALNDLLQAISDVDGTVRPVIGRNAQIAEEFSAVLAISDQRGDAIREGRARAKTEKSENGNTPSAPATPPAAAK